MITAILILTMFNTGLIILLTASALSIFRAENAKMLNIALHHVDETYTELGTWIYNMDSTKWHKIPSVQFGKVEQLLIYYIESEVV